MIKETLRFFYRRRRLLLGIMVAATASILLLTLLPSDRLNQTSLFEYDKIGHAVVFGCWTYLLGLVRIAYTKEEPVYLGIELLAGIAYGLFIELLQHFLPINRSGDVMDFLADLVGIVLAVYLLRYTYYQLGDELLKDESTSQVSG